VEAQEILQEKLQINLGPFFCLRGINLYIFSRFIAIDIFSPSTRTNKNGAMKKGKTYYRTFRRVHEKKRKCWKKEEKEQLTIWKM